MRGIVVYEPRRDTIGKPSSSKFISSRVDQLRAITISSNANLVRYAHGQMDANQIAPPRETGRNIRVQLIKIGNIICFSLFLSLNTIMWNVQLFLMGGRSEKILQAAYRVRPSFRMPDRCLRWCCNDLRSDMSTTELLHVYMTTQPVGRKFVHTKHRHNARSEVQKTKLPNKGLVT
jgi:hypothetical protein